jgi:hypothetical protein
MKSDQSRFIHLTTGQVSAKTTLRYGNLIQSYYYTLVFTSPSHCTRFELPVARRTTRRQLASKYFNGFVKEKNHKRDNTEIMVTFYAVS